LSPRWPQEERRRLFASQDSVTPRQFRKAGSRRCKTPAPHAQKSQKKAQKDAEKAQKNAQKAQRRAQKQWNQQHPSVH